MSECKNSSKENEASQEKPKEVPENTNKSPEMAVNCGNSNDCANNGGKENNTDQVVYRRFKFLKHALDKVIAKCSSAGKFSWYETHFPTLNKKKPTELKHIQEQVIQQLGENIRTEAKLMLAEENIEQIMNDLDVLIYKTRTPKNSVVWRPTGTVKDDVRAHLIPEKIKFRDSLRELLKNLEEENKQLKDVVSLRNKMLLRTKEQLDDHTLFFKKMMDTTDTIQKSFVSPEI